MTTCRRFFASALLVSSLAQPSSFAHAAAGVSPNDRRDDAVEIEFVYGLDSEASAPEDLAIRAEDLRELSEVMRGESYRDLLARQVVVPFGSGDFAVVRETEGLSKTEMERFLRRKTAYLKKVARVLTFLRVPPEKANGVLSQLNDELFRRCHWIASHNEAEFVSLDLGVGAQIAIPEFVRDLLRKAPLISGLAERDGFYLAFSLGLALRRTVVDNRTRYLLEPSGGVARGKEFLGATAATGVALSFSTGISDPLGTDGERVSFVEYAGSSLDISQGAVGVSKNLVGISFPPFGSSFGVVKGESVKLVADRNGLERLQTTMRDFFHAGSTSRSCQAIFAHEKI